MQNLKTIDALPEAFDREIVFDPRPAPPALGLAQDTLAEVPSPALALQQRLFAELTAEDADDDGRRWSPRATMMFCGAVSLTLWGAIALAISAFH
jgi:hypothetical protein